MNAQRIAGALTPTIFVSLLAALALAILQPSATRAQEGDADPNLPTRNVALQPGWNLVTWTGPATAVDLAVETIVGEIDGVFAWNAAEAAYRSYRPGSGIPPGLEILDTSRAVWVHATGAVNWKMPDASAARTAPLAAGWNLAGWTGPSGTPVLHGLAEAAGALRAAWRWDAGAQAFARFLPGHATLSAFDRLDHGDALWVDMTAEAPWAQLDPQGAVGGLVTRGPICPVQREGEPCPDLPYPATLHIEDAQRVTVASVQAGEDGRYAVALAPGAYTVVPESPPQGLPFASPVDVVVTAGRWSTVDISYDTGIR